MLAVRDGEAEGEAEAGADGLAVAGGEKARGATSAAVALVAGEGWSCGGSSPPGQSAQPPSSTATAPTASRPAFAPVTPPPAPACPDVSAAMAAARTSR